MSLVRRLPRTLAPLALALAAGACHDPAGPAGPPARITLPRALSAAEREAIAAGNDFSLALFRAVSARRPGENVVISPLSASMALGLTMNGADGATLDAMRRTLGVEGRPLDEVNAAYHALTALLLSLDAAVQLRSANAVFHRASLPVSPAFVATARRWYDADVRAADFADQPATLAAINGWAREATSGRIERVLDELAPGDVMFLLNALHFKGAWRSRFDPALTQPAPFTRADGTQQTVPLMHARAVPVRMGWHEAATVAELPYGGDAFAMTIVLPAPGQSVDDLVASLTPERWAGLLGALAEERIDVHLPRFRLRYEDEWTDVLTALGMGIAFDAHAADFGRLAAGGEGLYLSMVRQDVFLEVNEEGTEAAAVTTVGVRETSLPPHLRVDRPFVLAIRERLTGAVLFVGKVGSVE